MIFEGFRDVEAPFAQLPAEMADDQRQFDGNTGSGAGGGKFAEFGDHEGLGLHEARELHAREALKNEMRGAVFPPDARADEADSRDVVKIIR